MATLFGSAVASTGGSIRQSTRSFAHARRRATLSTYDGTPLDTDILVIGLVKSSDLCLDISFFTDGNATAGALDVGLSSVNLSNNGFDLTVVDVDLFASARLATSPIAYDTRDSVFSESTTLDDVMDRGKSFWALAALGAASYTEDPGLTFAVTATPSTSLNAATELGFLVEYVAGD